MTETIVLKLETPATYLIRVQGFLDPSYSGRLGGMTITTEVRENQAPVTTLQGRLLDQAALAGVLDYLYNLRLPILSLECLSIGC
jgi:hypothetical protein